MMRGGLPRWWVGQARSTSVGLPWLAALQGKADGYQADQEHGARAISRGFVLPNTISAPVIKALAASHAVTAFEHGRA